MKTRFARLAAAALVALGLAACSTTVPLDTPPAGMSHLTARQTLIRIRTERGVYGTGGWVEVDGRLVAHGADLVATGQGMFFGTVAIPYAGITRVSTSENIVNFSQRVNLTMADNRHIVIGDTTVGKEALARAIITLKQLSGPLQAQAVAFEKSAADYRAANPRPQPGELQRQREVQAEAMVADKQFLRAAETYEQAVTEAPLWPQGHFNFALVLESLGDYEWAISEMKRYLALVPDAENARAALDKIYEWETHLPTGASH